MYLVRSQEVALLFRYMYVCRYIVGRIKRDYNPVLSFPFLFLETLHYMDG